MSRAAAGFAAALGAAVLLAACSGGPGGRGGPRGPQAGPLRPIAQPGEVVANELAFARFAREEGQRAAFLEFAADGALMFVPHPVRAGTWLRSHDLPASPVSWQPYHVWSSCDGSLAVTRGAWQRENGSFGYFVTIWQRQNDGSYRWALNTGGTLEQPLPAADMIGTDVADCPVRQEGRPRQDRDRDWQALPGSLEEPLEGEAADGSLRWTVGKTGSETRELHVSMKRGGTMSEVLSVAAPARQ